jgi:hypothetical protein
MASSSHRKKGEEKREGICYRVFLIAAGMFLLYLVPCFFPRGLARRIFDYPLQTCAPRPSPVTEQDPVVQPERQKVFREVNQREEVPKELVDSISFLKSQLEALETTSGAIEAELRNLQAKAQQMESLVDEAIPLLAHTVEISEDSTPRISESGQQIMRDTIVSRMIQDEKVQLLLVAAAGGQKRKGAPVSKRLFRDSEKGRWEDELPRNDVGLLCIKETAANFSFWSPKELSASDFDITAPPSAIQQFRLLFLRGPKRIVAQSGLVKISGGKTRVKFGEAVTFTSIWVDGYNDAGQVCVGNLTAFGVKRIE